MAATELPSIVNLSSRPIGYLKVHPHDFEVEEIPAYFPSGGGEHLYLWIEKRNVAAEELLRMLARQLDVPQQDIGCAGLKDKRAVTRQWISIPARVQHQVDSLHSERVTILDRKLHGNKLKSGHLRGNLFRIFVRSCSSESETPGPPISIPSDFSAGIEKLKTVGFANYYGDQRFGREGETLQLGFDLLLGTRTPKQIPYSRRRFLLKLALSSVQSHLFNLALAQRIRDGLISTVLPGDVMEVLGSGGMFVAEDPQAEQIRLQAGEIAITGPMYGPRMKTPIGLVMERELRILSECGLTFDSFSGWKDLLPGTRRPYTIRPRRFSWHEAPEGVLFEFELPPGVYATTLLGELFAFESTSVPGAGNISPETGQETESNGRAIVSSVEKYES